ncbi:MAG: 1-acyl-sn-glycerol-3-phosphate acyltransferase [Ruminococcus sp.]|nr:1-acyl-sn-glycerol-3-phosphate acyltransferase [Ruminococcus sp.]
MKQSQILYKIGRVLCKPIFKLLYRYKVVNSEAIPNDGKGYLIACNHLSYSDPVLIGLAQKRNPFFMAKVELFKNKFFGALIRALGAFPVERGAGDGKAINIGEQLLKEGNIVTIFIEGGRSKTGELMRPRSGAALVALQTGIPIIPACITVIGNPKHTFAKRVIHFGEPMTTKELGLISGDRRELKVASEKIMSKIREFRENDLSEYKGS